MWVSVEKRLRKIGDAIPAYGAVAYLSHGDTTEMLSEQLSCGYGTPHKASLIVGITTEKLYELSGLFGLTSIKLIVGLTTVRGLQCTNRENGQSKLEVGVI